MNILVTGAAGYVGSVCAAELAKQRHRVVAYDNLSAGHRGALSAGMAFVQGDIADSASVRRVCRKYQIKAVMHFAASALVDVSVRDPHLFYQNNVSGSLAFLGALLEEGVKKLIFSSSAAVYGEPQEVPITEDHPTQPVSPYGETKLVLERTLAWYHRAYGLDCIALRYFNAAGATGRLGEDHRPETHLLPQLLDTAFSPHKPFEIYGGDYPTPDGTCIRDFVHVRDIAQAHVQALRALPKIGLGVYNVGHGQGYSIREVVKVVEEVTGRKLRVQIGPRRPGDPAVLVASPRKLCRELKWKPRCSELQTIVRSAWAWKQQHPDGYKMNGRKNRVGAKSDGLTFSRSGPGVQFP
jgi:UDP-glucose 4-epimerase